MITTLTAFSYIWGVPIVIMGNALITETYK